MHEPLYEALRIALGLPEIAVSPAQKTIWLLGSSRTLTGLIRNPHKTLHQLQALGLEGDRPGRPKRMDLDRSGVRGPPSAQRHASQGEGRSAAGRLLLQLDRHPDPGAGRPAGQALAQQGGSMGAAGEGGTGLVL